MSADSAGLLKTAAIAIAPSNTFLMVPPGFDGFEFSPFNIARRTMLLRRGHCGEKSTKK
jgi:hypothetical protein